MRGKFQVALLAFLLPVHGSLSLVAQEAKEQIAAEIARVQQTLQQSPSSDPNAAPLVSAASQSFSEASAALASGQVYLSLEKLLQGEDLLHAVRFSAEKAEAVKSGYPAFEAEWKLLSQTVNSLHQELLGRDWSASPAALRALSETAVGRSTPLLDGGRGFALSTKPADGLFYLGQAQGETAFAQFASSLSLPRNPEPFPLRSFLPELRALQVKTNAAFRPPRSVELHARFIALNSALKLAQELDAQRSYAGALYQYLEAARHFALLDAPAVEASAQAELKNRLVAMRKRFSGSRRDDSIALLFLERASAQVAHPDGSPSSADEWRSAQVTLERVLPAYLAAHKPAPTPRESSSKTVQLTLVRWPYT